MVVGIKRDGDGTEDFCALDIVRKGIMMSRYLGFYAWQ
jgi:hypothetical protein